MRSVNDIDTIDRIFTPYEDTKFRNYLRDRFERTSAYLEKHATAAARPFIEQSRRIYDAVTDSETLRKTRATVRAALGMRSEGTLFSLKSLNALRAADHESQRFLMAEPVTRRAYHLQRMDGYSDTYRDNSHGQVGDDHYDYRRVVNNVYIPVVIDGEDHYQMTRHYEELLENDRELDPEEQFQILDAWDMKRMFFEAGLDPTNRLGGTIG